MFCQLTGNDLMVHRTALLSGEYLQLPVVVLNFGVSASAGTGMTISTLFAVDRRLNWLFACENKQHLISWSIIARLNRHFVT